VADQGVIEGEAAATLAYRRSLNAEHIAVCADILVKHAAPLAPITPRQAARDCVERGLADAIIVSGAATGEPVTADLLEEAQRGAGDGPVLIGSGLTPDNAPTLAPRAYGAIVGTWFKRDGNVHAPVDPERVKRLVGVVSGMFR
jgi:membrane complex biogenesis BtpA family protein